MSADTPAALDAHAAGMGHLGDQADLLVADTADGADAAMPHTPRYEPSWFYQELPAEMIEQCLRPRSRGGIDDAAAGWLHKHLVALGHAANGRAAHFMAHSWFECAYDLKDGAAELLSSINMRLRLGQATLAKHLYARVLASHTLTEAQREVAARKLAEAEAAVAARGAGLVAAAAMQDEMAQMLQPDGKALAEADLLRMVPLMRMQGGRSSLEEAASVEDTAPSARPVPRPRPMPHTPHFLRGDACFLGWLQLVSSRRRPAPPPHSHRPPRQPRGRLRSLAAVV